MTVPMSSCFSAAEAITKKTEAAAARTLKDPDIALVGMVLR